MNTLLSGNLKTILFDPKRIAANTERAKVGEAVFIVVEEFPTGVTIVHRASSASFRGPVNTIYSQRSELFKKAGLRLPLTYAALQTTGEVALDAPEGFEFVPVETDFVPPADDVAVSGTPGMDAAEAALRVATTPNPNKKAKK